MKVLTWVVLVSACVVIGLGISGWICMALWNWLAVAMFGAKPITYWMGLGIAVALSFIGNFFRNLA